MDDYVDLKILASVVLCIIMVIGVAWLAKPREDRIRQCIIEHQQLPDPSTVCEAIERSK